MFRPTTNIERSVDLLMSNAARLKTSTIGVMTKERRAQSYIFLDNIEEYITRLRKELDAVLYQ